MYIVIDDRSLVTEGYRSLFSGEGVPAIGFTPTKFEEWVEDTPTEDLRSVEAFLIGDCEERSRYPMLIRRRSQAPVIVMNEVVSLERTLELFAAGVDDVVRKPVHVREILARVNAMQRRSEKRRASDEEVSHAGVHVYFNGRDPEVGGEVLPLPRRERRILEFMMRHRGKWVTKTQVFNAVYGLFDAEVDEAVVESHISKLRKKLRAKLEYDPIESRRYLGYTIA
ncbi:MAG: response regulator transcription factor [Bosea sp.]|uniref:response regulator transcription factor n=1 Tax=Bosea sp. (in: a-proteobacteria) TaxID=1871050 RepID=UPI002383FEE6|nr:response regulator transcription factor [Bosea sp. (in: a-proteobacteria)]MCP4737775.1 response regulator transcription factor [Bosea sp. (in: a-proteobacteria)]